MGLVAWLGHSFHQPIWKRDRYHTSCRSCGARLRPTLQERFVKFAMPAFGVGAAVGLSATLHLWARANNLGVVLIGILCGVVAQYPLAKYELADPNQLSELPAARTTFRDR